MPTPTKRAYYEENRAYILAQKRKARQNPTTNTRIRASRLASYHRCRARALAKAKRKAINDRMRTNLTGWAHMPTPIPTRPTKAETVAKRIKEGKAHP